MTKNERSQAWRWALALMAEHPEKLPPLVVYMIKELRKAAEAQEANAKA